MELSEAFIRSMIDDFPDYCVTLGGSTPPTQEEIDLLVSWGVKADCILWAETPDGSPSTSPSSSISASPSDVSGTPSASASSSISNSPSSSISSSISASPSASESNSPSASPSPSSSVSSSPSTSQSPSASESSSPSSSPSTSVSSSPSTSVSSSPSASASSSVSSSVSSSPSATGGGGNSFSETFTYSNGDVGGGSDVTGGVWTRIGGDPDIASNKLMLESNGERVRTATTLSRGFAIELDLQMAGNLTVNTSSAFTLAVSSSATAEQSGQYILQFEMGTRENEEFEPYQFLETSYAVGTGSLQNAIETTNYSTSNRRLRVEFYGNTGDANSYDIVARLSTNLSESTWGAGTEIWRANNDSTNAEFSYLWLGTGGNATIQTIVDNLVVVDM